MKKNILTILTLIFFININAQHPDLEQGKWYVQSVTKNEITTLVPIDLTEFPYVYLSFLGGDTNLTFSENQIITENCNIGFFSHVNYLGVNIFEFTDITLFSLDTECSLFIQDFMTLYISFYEESLTEQFNYDITTEDDNSKTLIITNNNGDKVTFSDSFLNPPPQILVNNDWYLQNLIIDGINNALPNNSEISDINLNFDEVNSLLSTSACAFFQGTLFFNLIESQFYSYEYITDYGLSVCNIEINNIFTTSYIRDFYIDNTPGPYSYSITENGSAETLTITTENGDQAIYSNTTLSEQDYISTLFSIYPNPVTNKLIIKELSNDAVIKKISVYNNLGQKIVTTNNKNIDMSNLANGIYLIQIKLENGKSLTKKIIKI